MEDLKPNEYESCGVNDCLNFQSEYRYEYNEGTNTIDLEVYTNPIEYKLEINNNTLYIDDVEYIFEGFELTSDSDLSYEESDSVLFITLTLYLSAGEDLIFDFVLSYSYDLTTIPVS